MLAACCYDDDARTTSDRMLTLPRSLVVVPELALSLVACVVSNIFACKDIAYGDVSALCQHRNVQHAIPGKDTAALMGAV